MRRICIPRLHIKSKAIVLIGSIRNTGASTQSPTIFRLRRKDLHNSSAILIKELKHSRIDLPTIKPGPRNPSTPRLKFSYNPRRARTSERGELLSRSKKSSNVMSHSANVTTAPKALCSSTSSLSTLNACITSLPKSTVPTPEISLICRNTDQFLYQRAYYFNTPIRLN